MEEKDFRNCEFVNDGFKFFTFQEFVEDAKYIKRLYNELNYNQIGLYRWYVYAHTNISLNAKNLIWDFLNGDCDYDLFELRAKQVKK